MFDPLNVVEEALKSRELQFDRPDLLTIISGLMLSEEWGTYVYARHDVRLQTVQFLFRPMRARKDDSASTDVGQFLLHTSTGFTPAQITALNEQLLDLNYHFVLGGWDRDTSDGELRFRISVPYAEGAFNVALAERLLVIGLRSVLESLTTLGDSLTPSGQPATLRV